MCIFYYRNLKLYVFFIIEIFKYVHFLLQKFLIVCIFIIEIFKYVHFLL